MPLAREELTPEDRRTLEMFERFLRVVGTLGEDGRLTVDALERVRNRSTLLEFCGGLEGLVENAPQNGFTHVSLEDTGRQDGIAALPDPTRNQLAHFNAGGHETSRLAAIYHYQRSGTQRRRIGQAFYDHPEGLTDEEAAGHAGIRPMSCPWKRCSELREDGFLEDTGTTRLTQQGSPAKVWRMTDAGRIYWRDNVLGNAGVQV